MLNLSKGKKVAIGIVAGVLFAFICMTSCTTSQDPQDQTTVPVDTTEVAVDTLQ